jgi:hypothetical protein
VTLPDQIDAEKQRGTRHPRPDAVTKIVNDYDADGHLIGCHEEELHSNKLTVPQRGLPAVGPVKRRRPSPDTRSALFRRFGAPYRRPQLGNEPMSFEIA